MTVQFSRRVRMAVCIAALVGAAVTPSVVGGQTPPAGPCICSPLLMNIEGEPWQPSEQTWDFVTDASGTFRLTFFTHTVNPEESGSLIAAVLNGAGIVIDERTVSFPSGAGVLAGAEQSTEFTFAASAGDRFRLRVTNPPAAGAVGRAHHYRFEAHGAVHASEPSPGVKLLEPVLPQRWFVNVGSGEPLVLRVNPGLALPDGTMPRAGLRLVDPAGRIYLDDAALQELPRTITIDAPIPGIWRLDIISVSGHFQIEKLSGTDRNLYLTWLSAGTGSFHVAVTPAGKPLSLEFTNTTTGETFAGWVGPNVNLPVGQYTIRVLNSPNAVPQTLAADLPCNGNVPLAFDIPNRPPWVHFMGEPFVTMAGAPPMTLPIMAGDPDGDPLASEWTLLSGGGLLSSAGLSATYSSALPTVATVQVLVRDSAGATAVATTTVTVNGLKPPTHLWHADYTMEWNGPRTFGDQLFDSAYPFTYTWRFGILNDPTDVLDAPTIAVATSVPNLVASPPPDVPLGPGFPPYVWIGPQLARAGQGRSAIFTGLRSNTAVPAPYALGFDASRSVGGVAPANSSQARVMTFTVTPRDPTLTSMASHVNFGAGAPNPIGPVSASDVSCTSASGFTEPFSNGPQSWGVRWQIGLQSSTTPLESGVQHTMTCTVKLTNGSNTPALYAPQMMTSGTRSAAMVKIDGTSVSFTTDPAADPSDPLGTVSYDVTAPNDVVAQLSKHFARFAFLDGRNREKPRPIVSVPPWHTTPEGSVLAIPFQATSPDGQALAYHCSVVEGIGQAMYTGGNVCTYFAGDAPSIGPPTGARIVIHATDADGATGGKSTIVGVPDAPPQIVSITGPTAPLRVGTPASIDVAYTDPLVDSVTCTFEWSDGSAVTSVAGSANGCPATHTYAAPGVYTVRVTVADDDGGIATGAFEYVVVFNPDAGWVTGGGWFMSPAGSLAADLSGTGRANFGFNARYQGETPAGQTEFQFQNGRLNFHSSSYSWLVVAEGMAAYAGTGTINRAGSYSFVVIVTDAKAGAVSEDGFRIRIWNAATGDVVYDSEPGAELELPALPLGGGNITIHR